MFGYDWPCLIRNHLFFVVFFFCFFLFLHFSNIYCKINFKAKKGQAFAMSIVNWTFLIFFYSNIICFLMMLHNDIVKISEILNKWNMLKTCIQTTYPIDFRIFCGQVYYGKSEQIRLFLKPLTRIKLFCVCVHSSYDKWFCTKSG